MKVSTHTEADKLLMTGTATGPNSLRACSMKRVGVFQCGICSHTQTELSITHDQLVQGTQAGQPQTEHRDLTLMQTQTTEKQQQTPDPAPKMKSIKHLWLELIAKFAMCQPNILANKISQQIYKFAS